MLAGIVLIAAAVLGGVVILLMLLAGGRGPADEGGPGENQTVSMPLRASAGVSGPVSIDPTKPNLRERLLQAGLYHSQMPALFGAVRIFLAATPFGLGALFAAIGMCPMAYGLGIGLVVSLAGTLTPSFWLDFRKSARQTQIRRSLPDALDVIVVCLEGGLSLAASFARVGQELGAAHPLLALELRIVEREMLIGRSHGDALRAFANRFDLEELRSLAAVVGQAERYGSTVTKALSTYAETMRQRRQQRAETMAHKAVVKVMFPTVLCILPALFIVLLGPASFRIMHVLSTMQAQP